MTGVTAHAAIPTNDIWRTTFVRFSEDANWVVANDNQMLNAMRMPTFMTRLLLVGLVNQFCRFERDRVSASPVPCGAASFNCVMLPPHVLHGAELPRLHLGGRKSCGHTHGT